MFGEWSLITGRGRLQNGRSGGGGGEVKFNPYEKGQKSFNHAEGRDTKRIEVVLTHEPKVLAILMGGGGHGKFHPRGDKEVLPCLEGGGGLKVLDPRFSHFVAPPPPPRY